jgi:hypothetical protein
MRQNRSCRNGRPIKLLNRSGPTIQNFYTSDQMIAAHSTTLAGNAAYNDEAIKQFEADGWDNEQIHGGNVRRVITQEGLPSLAGRPPPA